MKFAALMAGLMMTASAYAQIPAGKYEIDPMHSKIGFEVPHLVISTVEGKFNTFSGNIEVADKIEKSKVDVSIDVNSVDTGVEKRDGHLKSADFFDAAKNPKITFKSTKVTGKPEDMKVTGDLTMHGKTKPVTLDVKYLGTVKDGYGNQKVAFNANGKLNRKDFGLNYGSMVEAGPVIGDEITLSFRIQAAPPAKK